MVHSTTVYSLLAIMSSGSLTTVEVMEDVVERAQSHEHTDGVDLRRCDDSQQWQNVLIIEHPVRQQQKEGLTVL